MKILLISQHFHPENFKCNDVAFELVQRGHDVTVLTGIPNYPFGKYFEGYGLFKKRMDRVGGVKIIRSILVPRGNGGAICLALNYFSFAFSASVHALFLVIRYKYDMILVHETSPITVGIPGVLAKKIAGIPMYFWVLDLWPESLTAAGGVTNKYILGFFYRVTKWIYRNSTRILISSRGFEQSILEKGDFADKLAYFPNWADNVLQLKNEYSLPLLPIGFRVMFAGNMGEAQDLEHLMEAAYLLKEEKDIHFVLVGSGRKCMWVERFIKDNKLGETVHWLGRYPLEAMFSFFKQADVLLVSLKDNLIFNLTVPAKIQAYMSAGKPILSMMNGEGSRIIEEAKCGFTTNAGNAVELAQMIRRVYRMKKEDLIQLGENGYRFGKQHFDFTKCMDHLCSMIEECEGK